MKSMKGLKETLPLPWVRSSWFFLLIVVFVVIGRFACSIGRMSVDCFRLTSGNPVPLSLPDGTLFPVLRYTHAVCRYRGKSRQQGL